MKNRFPVLISAAVVILGLQAILARTLDRPMFLPSPPPLTVTIPPAIGDWRQLYDQPLDPAALAMLSPDDALDRSYASADGSPNISLFVGYYRTQMRSKNAHDPKVCLPGAGWNPESSTTIDVPSEGGGTFSANDFVISKDGQRAVVLYWYQTVAGVAVQEQGLRLRRVIENLRVNRTDMALVRVVVPVAKQGLDAATKTAVQFAGKVQVLMQAQFPAGPEAL